MSKIDPAAKNLSRNSFWLIPVVLIGLVSCSIQADDKIPPRRAILPDWSPDGRHVAYVCYEDGPHLSNPESDYTAYTEAAAEICAIDVITRHNEKLTHNLLPDTLPIWSPDGKQIAFVGSDGLYIIEPDGKDARRIFESKWLGSVAWSPDGERLVVSVCRPKQTSQLFVVSKDGKGITQLTSEPNTMSQNPAWSPDGSRIAYQSSAGNCSETQFSNEVFRLRVFDIPNNNSIEVLDEDLYRLRDIRWLSPDLISFIAGVTLIDPPRFELDIVNVNSQQIVRRVNSGEHYATRYALSHDQSSIVYSNTSGQIYIDSLSGLPQLIGAMSGPIYAISWSPDDKSILVNSSDLISNTLNPQSTEVLWIISRDSGTKIRLTGP